MPSTNFYAASLLGAKTSSLTETLSSIYKNKLSYLNKDSKGKLYAPTLESLQKASSHADKIRVAGQLANSLKTYADAAARTGITTRLDEMTDQLLTVTNTVSSSVDALKAKNTLGSVKTSLSSTIQSLQSSLLQMNTLAKSLPKSERSAVALKIKTAADQLASISQKTGLSLSSNNKATLLSSVGARTRTSLVDFLA